MGKASKARKRKGRQGPLKANGMDEDKPRKNKTTGGIEVNVKNHKIAAVNAAVRDFRVWYLAGYTQSGRRPSSAQGFGLGDLGFRV